jgi:glyoxylase-like metal-dependent hydrolase (beta-lactamase superfamily II)
MNSASSDPDPFPDDCIQIRGLVVHFYALCDETGVHLIDGGFLGAIGRLERALAAHDRSLKDIRTILLTHGHIDHTLNVARLKELSGATVYAPAGDEKHVAGTYPYKNFARVCGLSEAIGRTLLHYTPPAVDHWMHDGDNIDLWGGLKVIHLPGHTAGHSGFYSLSRKLLFCGDLFANFIGPARRSPPWFSTDRPQIRTSLQKAAALNLDGGVLASHCNHGGPHSQRDAMLHLNRKLA